MQELILTIGLPASGKTTWVNHELQTNPAYFNVNRDDIRLMLQGRARYGKFTKIREDLVTAVQFNTAREAILAGRSVIVSDTNLNPIYKDKWKKFTEEFVDVKYVEKLFTDVHLGVCLERDKLREFPVSSNVITGMFEKYQDLYWPKPVFNSDLPNAYIFDIDGTVAHMHNRRAYEWNKVQDDLPKHDVIRIINSLAKNHTMIACSGRDGVCEDATLQWLDDHSVKFDQFYIRPASDSRKDTIIKEEIYNRHIKGKFNVLGVFDDRDQVIWLWRHLGLTCLQVDFGDF